MRKKKKRTDVEDWRMEGGKAPPCLLDAICLVMIVFMIYFCIATVQQIDQDKHESPLAPTSTPTATPIYY